MSSTEYGVPQNGASRVPIPPKARGHHRTVVKVEDWERYGEVPAQCLPVTGSAPHLYPQGSVCPLSTITLGKEGGEGTGLWYCAVLCTCSGPGVPWVVGSLRCFYYADLLAYVGSTRRGLLRKKMLRECEECTLGIYF